MADFILDLRTDSGTLNFPKTDGVVPPANADPTKIVSGSEWNSVCQALFDSRRALVSGTLFGFRTRYANVAAVSPPAGVDVNSLDFLYVRTDGVLVQHKKDGTETALTQVPPGQTMTLYSEVSVSAPPAMQQGSAVLYLRNNNAVAGSRRTQLVVRWGTDNTDTVIAEGPAY